MEELGDEFLGLGIEESLELVKSLKNEYSMLDMLNISLLNAETDINFKVHKYLTNFL